MGVLTQPRERTDGIVRQVQEKQPYPNGIPPLESGDRLSRAEFERRYQAHPHIKKAELIEGVVYVASPVHAKAHGVPHSDIITWLGVYRASTPGITVADNSTVQLDTDNEPQPDVCVWLDERMGGQVRITEDDYLEGAPELVVEISASSASNDLHDKKRIYRRNGVREYLVLSVYERKVFWFILEAGEYRTLEPDAEGIYHSQVFPGLRFDPSLYWNEDLAGLLALLQEGLHSPEHAAFVEQLQSFKNT